MIAVTHLDHSRFLLNCDLIQQIESTPDTVVTLTNHQKLTVLESAEEIAESIRLYRRSIYVAQTGHGEAALAGKLNNRDHNG